MQVVQPNQNFGFNYTAFDQAPGLFVKFHIYDASGSGSPIFLASVVGQYASNGSYAGVYFAETGIRYQVIGLVYTDGTYVTIDQTRAQFSDVFETDAETLTQIGFGYVDYAFSSSLSIRAAIYNTTTGSPVFETNVVLHYTDYGVYFGAFEGSIESNYQISSLVYTDGTYTTLDLNYAPASQSFTPIGLETPDPTPSGGALIDVTELFHDSDFVEGISLITRTPTVNALGENLITEATINSYGSVQPASGKTLSRLPEALRLSDVSSFWFQGVIIATAPDKYPSILVFKGRRYQVKSVQDWSSWGRGWTEGLCVAELPS